MTLLREAKESLANRLPPPVLSKEDFVRRYEAGEFGNHSPTWNNLKEFAEQGGSSYPLVHIRNRVVGGPTWYDIPGERVEKLYSDICFEVRQDGYAYQKCDPSTLYFSAMCPTERTTIQGEVIELSTGELRLYYSDVKKPMRDSLREGGRNVGNLEALTLLRRFMNPRSYGWLRWLLSAYPYHVVEFTCLDRCWGTEPGHNTLFWEVRYGY